MDAYQLKAEVDSLKKELEMCSKNKHESSEINELAAALAKAQGEMEGAMRNNVNPFFKSKYASFSDVVRASRPALTKNELAVIQRLLPDNNTTILETKIVHSSGQWLASRMIINPPKEGAQSMGSYISYMKRYSYAALVGVYTDDEDDDAQKATEQKNTRTKTIIKKNYEKVSSEQVQNIMFEIGEHTDIAQYLLKQFSITKLSDIPKEYYLKIIGKIRDNVKSRSK